MKPVKINNTLIIEDNIKNNRNNNKIIGKPTNKASIIKSTVTTIYKE